MSRIINFSVEYPHILIFLLRKMKSTIKVLLLLVLLGLATSAGFQCNVANCQLCSYPNTCGVCQNNYVLELNTTSGGYMCTAVTCPANCSTCYQDNICSSCSSGYNVTSTGQCTTNSSQWSQTNIPSNCMWGSNSQNCSLCNYGYTLKNGFCYPTISMSWEDLNCMVKLTSDVCQICNSGYMVGPVGICQPTSGINTTCSASNCVYCDGANNATCTMCASGYQLNNSTGQCSAISCSSTVSNCAQCSDSSTCSQCSMGYYLVNNTCYVMTNTPCGVDNCQTCLMTGVCGQCQNGYDLVPYNGLYKCVKLVCPYNITNCNYCARNYDSIFNANNILCGQCNTGYILVNGYCVANVSSSAFTCNVNNCTTCSYNNFCAVCQNGYTLTRTGQCRMAQCNVLNCQSCSLNEVCEQCNTNYTLLRGNFSNSAVLDNLQLYAYFAGLQQCIPTSAANSISCNVAYCQYCSSTNICANCITGYDINSTNSSQCVPFCNVTNCLQCAQGSHNSGCAICQPGYTLNSAKTTCTMINYTCPTGCSNSTGACSYNWVTMVGQCFECQSGMTLYNGMCYDLTSCSIFGCNKCTNWVGQNQAVLCLECQQGYLLVGGICIKLPCTSSVANCSNCVGNNTCVGCAQGFNLQNSSGTVSCVAVNSSCNVDNCLTCDNNNNNVCTQCAEPYVVRNGVCVCNFQNCLQCSQSTLFCGLCPMPLIATQRQPNCIPQPSLQHTCTVSNCQYCITSSQCSVCATGYRLNSSDFSCIQNSCSNLSNCLLCDQYGYECHQCAQGYQVDDVVLGGACKPINANYTCNITGCAVCDSNNNSQCASCLSFYSLTNSTTCTPLSCNITNCRFCLENNVCFVCGAGFFLNKQMQCQSFVPAFIGTCKTTIPYCQQCIFDITTNSEFCFACDQGFQFDSTTSQCIPQTNSIPNCKVQLMHQNNYLIKLPVCLLCQQGYFMNSWGQCTQYSSLSSVNCSVYNCLHCATNNYCSFCFVPWGISNDGTCQTNTTGLCGTNCNTCTSPTNCVTCVTNYLPSNGVCIQCAINGCQECQQANNCTTCKSTYTQITNSAGNFICLACNITNCNTCSQNNVCSACANNLTVSANGNACVDCTNVANCAQCSATGSCAVCNSGFQLYPLLTTTTTANRTCVTCNVNNCDYCGSNNNCMQCADGYSRTSNGSCITCNFPCATCSSSNVCATCVTPQYFATPNSNNTCVPNQVSNCITANSTNSSLCSQCATNYQYNSTTNTCNFICSSNCATCTSASVCTTCASGYYLNSNNSCSQCSETYCQTCSYNMTSQQTTCTACISGYYLSSTGVCMVCPGFCATCTSATSCQTLTNSVGQVLVTLTNGTQTVAVCAQGCDTCSNVNPQICLDCSDGFYLSNGVCKSCGSTCRTCSNNNATSCLSCYPNAFLITDSSNNGHCVACNTNCLTCQDSNNPNVCTSCPQGSSLSSSGTCVQNCPSNCLTCSSSTMCTQCQNGFTLFTQNSQVICVQCSNNCRFCAKNYPTQCVNCGNGFYLSGNTCVACDTNCATCSSAGCSSCVSGYFLTSAGTCSPNCQSPCATCLTSSPTKCKSCVAGYTLNPLTSQCTVLTNCNGACSFCPSNYVLVKGQCQQCSSNLCEFCSSTNTSICLSCMDGYYLDQGNNQCSACDSSCATCQASSTLCTSCSSGFVPPVNTDTGRSGFTCLPCVSPCLTCVTEPNICTSCIDGYTFSGRRCVKSFRFGFTLTLSVTFVVFNQNYFTFIQALARALSTTASTNSISILSTTSGSVVVTGYADPPANSATKSSNQQFNSLSASLATNNQIAGMPIVSSSTSVIGGTIDYNNVNLALILGICIPVGVLLIAGIVLYIYCKKKKSSDIIEQRIKEDSGITVKESFQLSANYRQDDTRRGFEQDTAIN